MATGRSNKLVGQVGEFLVCAELGRRFGLIATPFSGNVPGYDIIATNEGGASKLIQVKANNGGETWQLSGDKYLDIRFDPKTNRQTIDGRTRLPDPDTICVFVWLSPNREKADRFFILTRREFQKIVHEHYTANLERHGGRRPKAPESRHTAIRIAELGRFEDNWQLITDATRPKN
jgi:hypothetical protein